MNFHWGIQRTEKSIDSTSESSPSEEEPPFLDLDVDVQTQEEQDNTLDLLHQLLASLILPRVPTPPSPTPIATQPTFPLLPPPHSTHLHHHDHHCQTHWTTNQYSQSLWRLLWNLKAMAQCCSTLPIGEQRCLQQWWQVISICPVLYDQGVCPHLGCHLPRKLHWCNWDHNPGNVFKLDY